MLLSQANATNLSAKCLPINPPRPQITDEETLRQAWRAEVKSGGEINDTDKAIMDVMQDGRWRTAADIATAAGEALSSRAVAHAAHRLTRMGRLAADFHDGVNLYVKAEHYTPGEPDSKTPMQRKLFQIMEPGKGYTTNELVEASGMTRKAVSNLVQRMRGMGFVESRPLPNKPTHFEWRRS